MAYRSAEDRISLSPPPPAPVWWMVTGRVPPLRAARVLARTAFEAWRASGISEAFSACHVVQEGERS